MLTLMNDFLIEGPNGRSLCCITEIADERIARPEGVTYNSLEWSQQVAYQLFQGVSYLHACKIAHGGDSSVCVLYKGGWSLIGWLDLYTSNILLQLKSFNSWSEDQIYACVGQPTREVIQRRDDGPIDDTVPQYLVQPCNMQALEEKFSNPEVLIIDFGQAFYHHESPDVPTPKLFMPPKILFAEFVSPALDQWRLGFATIELCSEYSLFRMPFNEKTNVMKDVVAMLGRPPKTMWWSWEERGTYFEDDGTPKPSAGRRISVKPYPLEDRVTDIAKAPWVTQDCSPCMSNCGYY